MINGTSEEEKGFREAYMDQTDVFLKMFQIKNARGEGGWLWGCLGQTNMGNVRILREHPIIKQQ